MLFDVTWKPRIGFEPVLTGHLLSGQACQSLELVVGLLLLKKNLLTDHPFGRPNQGTLLPFFKTRSLPMFWEEEITDKSSKQKITTDKNIQTQVYDCHYVIPRCLVACLSLGINWIYLRLVLIPDKHQ